MLQRNRVAEIGAAVYVVVSDQTLPDEPVPAGERCITGRLRVGSGGPENRDGVASSYMTAC